jgi:copper(I)-binding protein
MLMDLRRPLQPGETVPLELEIEDAGGRRRTLAVQAPVRPIHGKDGAHPPVQHGQPGHHGKGH